MIDKETKTLRQYMKQNNRLRGIFFIGISLFFIVLIYWDSRLIITGEKTTGNVVNIQERYNRTENSYTYRPIMKYSCGGKPMTGGPARYSSTTYSINEKIVFWCKEEKIYMSLGAFINILIISMLSICFGAGAHLLRKHYKTYITMKNLSSYGTKVTGEVVDIIETGEKAGKMVSHILKVRYKDNILESESTFSDRIYLIKKGEKIDILVDDLDTPKNYVVLRENHHVFQQEQE